MRPELEEALISITGGARPADVESETLEFKEDGRTAKETLTLLADAAACFANADGGTVVLGVRDAAANAMLRGLRDRGLIVKASDQQRGPSVVYEPGPEFPNR